MKPECSRSILENYSSTKFYEKPFSENRVVSFGQKNRLRTDRHVEANNGFSQFYERVKKYEEI